MGGCFARGVFGAGAAVLVLAGAAGAGPRELGLPWWQRAAERKVGFYWIKTDLEAETANELARHLNLMHIEYSKRLASLPPRVPAPLNVLIFAHRDDYLETLRRRFDIDATGTGGIFFVTPAASGLAFWTESLPRRRVLHVLQHEGFHQFAYSRFGGDLPVWVNEGLAEFFGESVMVGRTLIIGQTNPRVIGRVRQAIELDTYLPFRRMLSMSPQQWSSALGGETAALQYHQAWSMVHFLVYGDNGRYVERFEAYLRLLNAGFPSEHAFIRAFETDEIHAFERRWRQYAQAARPSAFITSLERIEFLAEGALELSRRGVAPQSIEELRDALVAIDFVFPLKKHEVSVELRADDEAMYRIPQDDLADEQPIFVVIKTRRGQLTRRQRKLEETAPTPLTIATEDLRPKAISIRWMRDRTSGELSYELVVK